MGNKVQTINNKWVQLITANKQLVVMLLNKLLLMDREMLPDNMQLLRVNNNNIKITHKWLKPTKPINNINNKHTSNNINSNIRQLLDKQVKQCILTQLNKWVIQVAAKYHQHALLDIKEPITVLRHNQCHTGLLGRSLYRQQQWLENFSFMEFKTPRKKCFIIILLDSDKLKIMW